MLMESYFFSPEDPHPPLLHQAMHEMSLCLSMLEILESGARDHGFSKVRVVCVELGMHGCADPASLRFAFDIAAQNTLAEGARLDIIEIAVQAWCLHCDKLVSLEQDYGACPHCGGDQLRLETGQELRIKSLEVE